MTPESELRRQAEEFGQGHLFTFWERLSLAERDALLADVAQIDFATVARQAEVGADLEVCGTGRQVKVAAAPAPPGAALEAARARTTIPELGQERAYLEAFELALKQLSAGRVAAMTVAGGQGTRLGFDGPKGAFRISPIRQKPLFQLFAETLLWTRRCYGAAVPWYIMTSPSNDAASRAFFAEHDWFGLEARDVFFFQQGVMPALTLDGKILLEEPHRVALSPDGHGGSLTALARSGALADMRRRGVETLSYFQVDNPLVQPFDLLFLGMHAQTRSQVSSLTVAKADDMERVGNFVLSGGKLCVVEYSDLPEPLARARTPDGRRKFDLANVAIHLLVVEFLERLTAKSGKLALPWHRAVKKVPFVDLAAGRRVEPSEPNAVKLELFIFDALPLADRTLLLQVERGEVFSPVKNASGVDSVDTARRDLIARAARWLEACGVSAPRRADGQPDCTLEISPLLAPNEAALHDAELDPAPLKRGESYYFE